MNNNNFPPNIDPQTYSFLAVLIGSACVGDYTATEQNSIGNWLILVGQFILTAAAQQQMIESRIECNNININSRQYKQGGSHFTNNYKSNQNTRDDVEFLLNAVKKIQKELEKYQ